MFVPAARSLPAELLFPYSLFGISSLAGGLSMIASILNAIGALVLGSGSRYSLVVAIPYAFQMFFHERCKSTLGPHFLISSVAGTIMVFVAESPMNAYGVPVPDAANTDSVEVLVMYDYRVLVSARNSSVETLAAGSPVRYGFYTVWIFVPAARSFPVELLTLYALVVFFSLAGGLSMIAVTLNVIGAPVPDAEIRWSLVEVLIPYAVGDLVPVARSLSVELLTLYELVVFSSSEGGLSMIASTLYAIGIPVPDEDSWYSVEVLIL